jgi:hypothetical protein
MVGRLLCLSGVLAAAAFAIGCSEDHPFNKGLEATALCGGSTAELSFEPERRIEVRAGDRRLAEADSGGREIDFDECERVKTQRSWFTGIPYARTKEKLKLVCRFRHEFFVHVHPVFTSESGEFVPDGSAVYLVVGTRRKIVASASVVEAKSTPSSLSYSHRYCGPR